MILVIVKLKNLKFQTSFKVSIKVKVSHKLRSSFKGADKSMGACLQTVPTVIGLIHLMDPSYEFSGAFCCVNLYAYMLPSVYV